MNGLLGVLALIVCGSVAVLVPVSGPAAILVCGFCAAIAAVIIRQAGDAAPFLLRLFAWALLVRLIVGTIIFVFNLQEFFGGDAYGYDY